MVKILFVNRRFVVYNSAGATAASYDNKPEAIVRAREVEREERIAARRANEKKREQRKQNRATKKRKMKTRFKRKRKDFDAECVKEENGKFIVLVARKGEPWCPVGEYETRADADEELAGQRAVREMAERQKKGQTSA